MRAGSQFLERHRHTVRHALGATARLAPAGDAFVGVDAHEYLGHMAHVYGFRRDNIRPQIGDLHVVIPYSG